MDVKPGRELDALVAKAIGCDVGSRVIDLNGPDVWTKYRDQEEPVKQPPETRTHYYCRCVPLHIHNCDSGQIPHYSTDIAAAWEVVEHMRKTYSRDFSDFRLVADSRYNMYSAVFYDFSFQRGLQNNGSGG